MASMYFPIKNHGGIPNMLSADGGISIKRLVKDTCVGKKKVEALPHLIANTVDNVARGMSYSLETSGEPSLVKPSQSRKLIKDTKVKVPRASLLEPSTHNQRVVINKQY